MRRLLGVVAIFWLVAGCAGASSRAPSAALPTYVPSGACLDVGLEATLHGDASDPRVAWLMAGSRRLDVVWPQGYRAEFAPQLKILDASGTVILVEGDAVHGACDSGEGDIFYMDAPF